MFEKAGMGDIGNIWNKFNKEDVKRSGKDKIEEDPEQK